MSSSHHDDVTNTTRAIAQTMRVALQENWALRELHITKAREHELEAIRIRNALEHLGEPVVPDRRKTRPDALRDYMLAHPGEEVTTKSIRANPARYGIITSSAIPQVNWLHGKNNPTARKYFEVSKGVIRLRSLTPPPAESSL